MNEETRISPQFYEYGEFIEDGERTDLTDIMHDIENGMSSYDLSKKHGNRFIRVMKWAKNTGNRTWKTNSNGCFAR